MRDGPPLKIASIAGSLRKCSFNRAALKAVIELAPADMAIAIVELGDLPLYNDDIRVEGYPPAVHAYRETIRAADGVLFATPEFNYSVSAPLKNAIDWGSRIPDPPYVGKATAIISASAGPVGGVRAQLQLRHMCVSLNCFCMNQPQVYIGEAPKKFDANSS
ncbi:MAG: NAD(P)H-dependent oxidoreductase [Alphaproteobacteria bacterium]|nr:NAD(P)H-dependent oxidoreductase [Alphaproteobacteria bacterium]